MVSTARPAPAPQVAEGADREVLTLIARQVGLIPWPVLLVACLVGAVAARQADAAVVLAWVAAVVIVLLIRWRHLHRPPAPQEPLGPAMRRAVLLSGLNGVTHAVGLLFFSGMSELERSVVSMLLVGLTTGAVGTTAGHPGVYRAYALPVMLSLSMAWAVSPLSSHQGWMGASMAVLSGLYLMVLLSLARHNHQSLLDSVALRQRETALNQELRQALRAAEQANAAKTRFLASASHDLRQPLHTLTLFSAALKAQPLDERSAEIVGHMNIAINALGEQLSSLLDISKLDAGTVHAHLQPLAVQPLLDSLYRDFLPWARHKGLHLALEGAPGLLAVQTDGALLARIVRNLLDNAVKYSDAGTVWLGARAEGGRVLIHVRDTGRGIAPAHQRRVFEEFFQVDNPERDRSKGLGLGLSIVQRLAYLLDITVTLRSEPGVGTEVELSLPAATQMPAPPEPAPDAPAAAPMCHMLVIDDEAEVRAAMRSLLGTLGCQVTLAASTDEAVRLAALDPPDIVLADFRLRGEESGIKAIRQLRERQPALPALLISGDTAPDRIQEAEAEGLSLLHKPVSVDELLQAIQQALEGAVAAD